MSAMDVGFRVAVCSSSGSDHALTVLLHCYRIPAPVGDSGRPVHVPEPPGPSMARPLPLCILSNLAIFWKASLNSAHSALFACEAVVYFSVNHGVCWYEHVCIVIWYYLNFNVFMA